ncbi:MAG: biotin--[acetyl-CoA-carboxylase] ligase [Alkalispirochaetaceae bacterium]
MSDLSELTNPFNGARVIHLPEVDSTMAEARRLIAEKGEAMDGVVIVADHQRAGVGRAPGRTWVDEAGESLLFTLLLADRNHGDLGRDALRISLSSALALAEAIELIAGVAVAIKWPNDLLLRGRKLSGILAERGERFIRLGIGVNLNGTTVARGLGTAATSLRLETGRRYRRRELLEAILKRLHLRLLAGEIDVEAINRRLAWRGRVVELRLRDAEGGESVRRGVLAGLDGAGNLTLRRKAHLETVDTGRLISVSPG